MIVGVDIGGTFTDLVAVDGSTGAQVYHKLPSTPDDPARAVIEGLEQMGIDLESVERLIHGTTLATNTILQRNGAVTGLVTTAGHRDVLQIRRGNKPESQVFNPLWEEPTPIVPRFLRVDVTERTDYQGKEITPLDEGELRLALDHLDGLGVEAVAVCFLFSYLSKDHEIRAREIIESEYAHLAVSVSHEILPQWREYERTATTVADAYVKPRMGAYIEHLETRLRSLGYDRDLLIMRSNGGIMSGARARQRPVETFLSGPAAGVVAGRYTGRHTGNSELIVVDMGGTSADVSLITRGEPSATTQSSIDDVTPLNIAMLDIRTIGAGGGSVAWIDPGGVLKVGPVSAGADPGPACYAKGGQLPTVTDANVVLGRIGTDTLLGGRVRIDPDLALDAIERHIARPLAIDPVQAAAGIVRVTVANMAAAIRAVTAERGVDPRQYSILAGGGGGPLHCPLLAHEFGMDRVIVPAYPGLMSASGLVLSDLRVEVVRSSPMRLERDGTERLTAICSSMLQEAIAELRQEGFEGEPATALTLVMRYLGQNWEIDVPIGAGEMTVESLSREFDETHQKLYGFDLPTQQHELLAIRTAAVGPTQRADDLVPRRSDQGQRTAGEDPQPAEIRRMWNDLAGKFEHCPVFARDALGSGDEVHGPATIEGADSAVWLPAGARSSVDPDGNIIVNLV